MQLRKPSQNLFSEALQCEKTKDAEQRCPVPQENPVVEGFCVVLSISASVLFGPCRGRWTDGQHDNFLALEPASQLHANIPKAALPTYANPRCNQASHERPRIAS